MKVFPRKNRTSKILREYSDDAIAVIAMAGKFPQADNIDEYWNNLKAGKECIHQFSDKELLKHNRNINYKNYVKARAILNGIDKFDEHFLKMSL